MAALFKQTAVMSQVALPFLSLQTQMRACYCCWRCCHCCVYLICPHHSTPFHSTRLCFFLLFLLFSLSLSLLFNLPPCLLSCLPLLLALLVCVLVITGVALHFDHLFVFVAALCCSFLFLRCCIVVVPCAVACTSLSFVLFFFCGRLGFVAGVCF